MLFEIAGFVSGFILVSAALWRLYARDSSRVMEAVYGTVPGRLRAPETMP